jgi:hypothetical protein
MTYVPRVSLVIVAAVVCSGCGCPRTAKTVTPPTLSALTDEMREHPCYAKALAQRPAFVYPRGGYPGRWRYTITVPSEFVARMLALGNTVPKQEPNGDAFERHVWTMAYLLTHGRIADQSPVEIDGFSFVSIKLIAPTDFD